jgi:hypothetical protein
VSAAEARLLTAVTAMGIAEVATILMSLATPRVAALRSMSAGIVPSPICGSDRQRPTSRLSLRLLPGEKCRFKLVGSNGRDRCLEYSGREKMGSIGGVNVRGCIDRHARPSASTPSGVDRDGRTGRRRRGARGHDQQHPWIPVPHPARRRPRHGDCTAAGPTLPSTPPGRA